MHFAVSRKTKSKLYILYSIFYILTMTLPAYAVSVKNPLGTADIPTLAGTILKTLLGLTGSVALLMFIWGGLLWLTSAGNTDKIKKGKETLVWAAIGLAFIFSSYIIANFVIQALTGRL